MPSIKLQSLDGEVFEVDVEIAKQSVTIKTMLDDLGVNDDDDEAIPLPNVNAAILKKVIQWSTYHKVSVIIVISTSYKSVCLYTLSLSDLECVVMNCVVDR